MQRLYLAAFRSSGRISYPSTSTRSQLLDLNPMVCSAFVHESRVIPEKSVNGSDEIPIGRGSKEASAKTPTDNETRMHSTTGAWVEQNFSETSELNDKDHSIITAKAYGLKIKIDETEEKLNELKRTMKKNAEEKVEANTNSADPASTIAKTYGGRSQETLLDRATARNEAAMKMQEQKMQEQQAPPRKKSSVKDKVYGDE